MSALPRCVRHARVQLPLIIRVLLLTSLTFASLCAVATVTTDFTAAEQTHTRTFLRGFLSSGFPLGSNWTGDDFCTWHGVSCLRSREVRVAVYKSHVTGSQRMPPVADDVDGAAVAVTAIWLYRFGAQLSGPLPPSWGRLTRLRQVALTLSTVGGTLPPEWGNLTRMQELQLGSCGLTGSVPATWGSMAALQTLYLPGNSLIGTLPPTMGSLTSLINLAVFSNRLSGSIPDAMGALPLAVAYVHVNRFCGCLPSGWVGQSYVQADAAVTASTCATANACPTTTTSTTSTTSSTAAPPTTTAEPGTTTTTTTTTTSTPTTSTPSTTEAPYTRTSTTTTTTSAAPVVPPEMTTTTAAPECAVQGCARCEENAAAACVACYAGYALTSEKTCREIRGDSVVAPAVVGLVAGVTAAMVLLCV